jgi:glucose/arabinose dehydrogenase
MDRSAVRRLLLALLAAPLGGGCGTEDAASTGGDAAGPVDDGKLRLDFELVTHSTGFALLTDLVFLEDPEDELLVADRDGGIAQLRLDGDRTDTLTQFQIPDVYIDGAAGLLGLTIDPDFARNRFFYAALAASKERNVIRRFTLHTGDPAATLDSQVDVFEVEAADAPRWHNIASMGFEKTGVLWALVGDKGMFEPAQDPASALGSLVRIVPSREEGVGGHQPAGDNDFAPGANPDVYAKGIRSPWRGVYHRGRWIFGDVGLDDIEEVDIIDGPHQNFGWPLREGPCRLGIGEHGEDEVDCADLVEPWIHYDQSGSHPFVLEDEQAAAQTQRSVYVGWVYQPRDDDPYEGRWNDVVTFGDTFIGFVRARRLDSEEPDWHAGHLEWATGWRQAPDGYVYVTTLGTWPPDEEEPPPSTLHRAVLRK